ncbi:hypothetical protein AAJ76_200092476 [Vairimorpha ceranae]|uniref:Uncharacterized protein n=1 Tax=Vairimorpha ceranae TaxID=40302 RepID=A0A0F9YVX5_9MICR|nr:hypothetical protein AAJ76_200092476 [Vairimorpha ceranae]KKO76552.1 hypothetical protein AAJ76_200092476 [Vairimorpha ceranae]
MYCLMIFYIMFILGDNIEISKSEFDCIIVKKHIIDSNSLNNYNSVKISFPGTVIYKLVRKNIPHLPNARVFILENNTVYFKKFNTKIRINFERKFFGLILDVWFIIMLMVIISSYFLIFCKKPFYIFDL